MWRKIQEMLKCQQGFTLVELMAVIAIIGVLAAIAIPRFANATDNANIAKIQADLHILDSAVSMSNAAGDDLSAITIDTLVSGGYLRESPAEPGWGGTYGISGASDTPAYAASYTNNNTTVYANSTHEDIKACKPE